jgi:iron complex outermembrane receptor protein
MTKQLQTGEDLSRAPAVDGMTAWLMSLALGTLALDAPATPEPAGAEDAVTLETMTVVGEQEETAWGPAHGYVARRSAAGAKTDTPLIETPQTVNIVTREEIAARAAQNISQAAAYSPGLISETFGPSTRDDYFYIRGFEAAQYLDGTRLAGANYGNLRIEPYALERFEILRGPASMLYGQNPPSGLINMVSKRPLDVPFHEIQMLGGSFNRVQGMLDLSGPVDAAGQFLYRLTALGRGSDTQVDHSEDDRYFVAPSFTWRPSEDTSLTFLSHYQKDEAGNTMQFLPPEGTLLPNPNGKIPTRRFLGEPGYDHYHREQFAIGYAFEHRFDTTWTFRQNLRYAHVESDYPVIFPDGFVTDDNGNVTDYRTLLRAAGLYRDQAGTFTLDNHAQAVFDTGPLHHTALLGADYRSLSGDRRRGFSDAPNLDLYNPVYGLPFARPVIDSIIRQDRDQFGLYGQDQIKYGGWIATVGVRYDWANADTVDDDLYFATRTRTRQDDEAFTYRTGLGYLFDSGFAPYFSYSESFDPAAGTDFSGKPFDPTTGQQYEVGVKYQPPGYNAFITLSAFHLTQQNVLSPDPAPGRDGYFVQTGEARSRGIELEGKASPAEGLDLTAAYSYVDSETTKTTDATQLGKNLPYTPKHQGSTWLDYTFQRGTLQGFGLGGGVRYVGSNYGDFANTLKTPSYTLIDAAVHYDLGRMHESLKGARLAVNMSNLFDREYLSTCGEGSCYYGDRRSVLASLRYNW